jgi:Flp pilus assembly protein TadD
MRTKWIVAAAATALTIGLFFTPARAALEVSSAQGVVTDHEGNPLAGAKIVFQNTANEKARYETKTNKKGRYFLDGLLWYNTGKWLITVELEGYVPTKIAVWSRTQTRTVYRGEKPMSPHSATPEVDIRPTGKADVDFELTPTDVWDAAQRAAAAEAAAAGEAVALVEGEGGEAEAVQPKEDPWEKALRLAREGDLEGSLEPFRTAIEDRPDDHTRVEAYAKVLYQLRRFDEAKTEILKAIEAGADTPGLYEVLYGISVSQNDYETARTALERAIELDPYNRSLLEQSAWLAGESGRTEDAIAAYKKMTDLDPENASAWIALGGLYAKTGQEDLSRQAYEQVVAIDPSNAYQTFYNIGVLIQNKQDISDEDNQRSIDAFRKAVEIKPDYAPAYKALAFALLRTGDRDGTKEALEHYVELEPDSPDAPQMQAMIKSLSQ